MAASLRTLWRHPSSSSPWLSLSFLPFCYFCLRSLGLLPVRVVVAVPVTLPVAVGPVKAIPVPVVVVCSCCGCGGGTGADSPLMLLYILTYIPYYLANTPPPPPSRQRPPNSFDENYCAGTIISEDSDCD